MKCLLLVCLLCLPFTAASNQAVTDDAKLKAALIYRFVQFTVWPDGPLPSLQYCVLGDEGVFNAIQSLISQTADRVSMLQPNQSAEQCDVLYVAVSAPNQQGEMLVNSKKTVLTIAENAQIFRQGMVIGLIIEPKRLSFRVNLQMAKQQGLTLSSQMLKLAKEIY